MEEQTRYSAFISYRHLMPDMKAAEKLQVMIENYRPPKELGAKGKIGKVFLDRTELPTSRDLSASLKDALFNSEFLIVILSEHLKESKWCMQEIIDFKKAHGGKLDRILPVLVAGEPEDVLPEELCFEEILEEGEDGTVRVVRKEVEPLCCDIRATHTDDPKVQMREIERKMKTEVLRLIAPILGCSYDDLYQRQKRRERRRTIAITSGVIGILSVLLAVVTTSFLQVSKAYEQVTISEQKYREQLMDSYASTGAERASSGKPQEAMAYYVKALSEIPGNRIAKLGALIELQDLTWISKDSENGSSSTTADLQNTEQGQFAEDAYEIKAESGSAELVWKDGRKWTFDLPELSSVYLSEFEQTNLDEFNLAVQNIESGPKILVTKGGYLCIDTPFYGSDPAGETVDFRLRSQTELGEALKEWNGSVLNLPAVASLWASPYDHVATVAVTGDFLFFDTDTGNLLTGCNEPYLNASYPKTFIFSPDKAKFAYTIQTSTDIGAGSILHVGRLDGYGSTVSNEVTDDSLVNLAFIQNSDGLMWAQDRSLVTLRGETAVETSAKLALNQPIVEAVPVEDDRIATVQRGGAVQSYTVNRFRKEWDGAAAAAPSEGTADRFRLTDEGRYLELLGDDGSVIERVETGIEYAYTVLFEESTNMVYCTSTTGVAVLALSEDGRSFTGQDVVMMEEGNLIVSECAYPGGFAVSIKGKQILIYRDGEKTPYRAIDSRCNYMALDGKGLLAAYGFTEPGIRIWDVETGSSIANILSYENQISKVDFTEEGDLVFATGYGDNAKEGCICLNAPDPDEAAVAALNGLCCYTLDDDFVISVKDAVYDGDLGNWQEIFR